jgi:hypothetical protein
MSDWGKDNPPRPEHPPIDDLGELSEMLATAIEIIEQTWEPPAVRRL